MSSRKRPSDGRMSRALQARHRERSARMNPQDQRRAWLQDERGALVKEAPHRLALCYPNPYRVAMSSLGYQVVYRTMNDRPWLSAERVVLPDDVELYRDKGWVPCGIETGRPLNQYDTLAFSIAYDLDISGFFDLLSMSGVTMLSADRRDEEPAVLLGGPLTASNPLPLGPFIDLAVIGDAEVALPLVLDAMEVATGRRDLMERCASIPGVWIPALHGDAVPATQKVTVGSLPAYGQIMTPHTELSNMFLIEASRGCPRFCKFCLVRASESPMREPELEAVMARIPDDAPRVGFVGAAVSEWTGIRSALDRVVKSGRGVGVSSLRADRLDQEFVDLLARGGYRTMTVASDAPSQRLRNKLAKGIRTRHLRDAAQFAREAGMNRLKMYLVMGLPDEREDDIDELIEFARELSSLMPLALGICPLVPKLHTPLGDAPFVGVREADAVLKRIRRELKGAVDVRSVSARWAWVEYRLSQGDQETGLAALDAWRQGGRFAHWKAALSELPERGGLDAALRFGLFQAVGMR